ncbi:hypothetical protein RIF29_39081 [Crotalaria pallida]|uniref:Uncharacterized protein n=1 Tax=Crotalaria pallida TaxID=3830 RepID=A0AAN9HQC5_CROPI
MEVVVEEDPEESTARSRKRTRLKKSSHFSRHNSDYILIVSLSLYLDKYTYVGDALQASVQDLAIEEYDYAYMQITVAKDYPNACHNAFNDFMLPANMVFAFSFMDLPEDYACFFKI